MKLGFRAAPFAAALGIVVAIAPASADGLKPIAIIALPGAPLTQFGAVYVDQQTGLGFLTNRDNKGVDVFDARGDSFVKRVEGFVGIRPGGSPMSGPQGVTTANDGAEAWATDGDSTVKIIDVAKGAIVGSISTGGKKRVGEVAYDPRDHVVIATNTNDEPPFVTLISTTDRKIIAKIDLPSATDGIERPSWHSGTGLFYAPLPKIDHDDTAGGLAVIDPRAGRLVSIQHFADCVPHSVAEVAGGLLYLGCDVPGERLAVFDPKTDTVVRYVPKLGGGGQTAVNPNNGQYYAAINRHPAGPQMKVIDTRADTLVQTVPAATGAHAVAVFTGNGHVFVPESNVGPCGGCIKVYAPE
jgi:DNA-binding beta-propeller fold protein YncE